MFKKLLASFFLSIFLLTSVYVPLASAQEWFNQDPLQWYQKVYDENVSPTNEIFGERYTAAQVEWVIYSVLTWPFTKTLGPGLTSCALSIADISACINALVQNTNTSNLALIPATSNDGGLLSAVFQDRPLSGITYGKNLIRKLHIIPQAQAQEGFGYMEALLPVQEMWRAARNIAYGLFVVVAIVLAFMIMFRIKISPQVSITVQSALPKIIIAVVLVTFSYAIAGLLIDLMYVVIGLISLLATGFFPSILLVSSTKIFNILTLGQPFSINIQYGAISLFAVYLIFFALTAVLVIGYTIGGLASGLAAGLTVGAIVAFFPTGFGMIFGLIALIIFLIGFFVLLWMFVKTLFMLFKAYAGVILLTIFAPFQILIGTLIPGMGFGRWVKSFVANLSVFVVTGLLFLLAYTFLVHAIIAIFTAVLDESVTITLINAIFGVGLVGGLSNLFAGTSSAGWPPLLGAVGGSGEAAVALLFLGVSFVIFTLIPKTADIIHGLISGRPFAYGSAIGEAFGPITGPAVGIWRTGTGAVGQGVKGFAGPKVQSLLTNTFTGKIGAKARREE